MDPLVGGSCWRFGMPGLKLILVDQSSNIQVEKKISCRSTITSTTIPVDDSIKLVPLPSVVRRIEWWQLPIAHCCFMSTFLRFRSAHHSTQWQRRTCDLQAICMRFVFLWSTQPIHEMMALSAETNWPLRKPMPNGTQRPGSGPWSLNSNWVLAVFLWSSFLWKCTAKKKLTKAFQHVHTKTKAKFGCTTNDDAVPCKTQDLWNPLPCWATSGCGWDGV